MEPSSSALYSSSVTPFIADYLTDFVWENEKFDLRTWWYIEDLGDELNPLCSPILFDQMKIQVEKFLSIQSSPYSLGQSAAGVGVGCRMNVNTWQSVVDQCQHWRRKLGEASMEVASSFSSCSDRVDGDLYSISQSCIGSSAWIRRCREIQRGLTLILKILPNIANHSIFTKELYVCSGNAYLLYQADISDEKNTWVFDDIAQRF